MDCIFDICTYKKQKKRKKGKIYFAPGMSK